MGITLDGVPFVQGKLVEPVPDSGLLYFKVNFSNAELDNLSARPATPSEGQQWARWRAERESYDVYKNFEFEQFWSVGDFSMVLGGNFAFVRRGLGGGMALECKGTPTHPVDLGILSAQGAGIRTLVRFD